MQFKLFHVFLACLMATSMLITGCGGGGGSDSSAQSAGSTGNLSGSVSPGVIAESMRGASSGSQAGHVVKLYYYDNGNDLQSVPGVESVTTDAGGKYILKNIPTAFFNMIIRVTLKSGQTLDGFVPALKSNGETEAPEINQTVASLALILTDAASYRKESGLSGNYHISMGEIMSMIRPSQLVQLNAADIRDVVKIFIAREQVIRETMDSADVSAYESAAFEKARELCEAMAKKGSASTSGLDKPWEDYGNEMRNEIRNLPPKAVLILQQANALISSLPEKMPANMQNEIQNGIQTRLEQDCYINNMHALLHALRILSQGLSYTKPESIDSTETGINTLSGTIEKASNGIGVGQAFAGNFVPDQIFAQIQALFDTLGLFNDDPSLLSQILAGLPGTTTDTDPAQKVLNRGQAMKTARENLDKVVAAHPDLAKMIDSEAKKQALIFLLFGPGDIGIPMPYKPGQKSGSTETRTFFGLLLTATDSYQIGTYSYNYIITPPPGFLPPPASWGHLVYVRPGENIVLVPSKTQAIEAVVKIEQVCQPDRAPAGVVSEIKPVEMIPVNR